jgi:glycosyltransferase involved in cell wall biosynthesis
MLTPEREARARQSVRGRYGISDDAVVFGCFGGMTPEKRLPQILAAFRATRRQAPSAHLLLAGAPAAHYDVDADIAAHGLQPHVTVAGYLESDADLTDHLAACDVSLNLRWPTARETSGPWLRALAAGRATIITDLVHLADAASLDPRTWEVNAVSTSEDRRPTSVLGLSERSFLSAPSSGQPQNGPRTSDLGPRQAIAVAIDILDEDHSLRLAMRRLADDAALRARLGAAARQWWQREHSLDVMVGDYERVIAAAVARPAPGEALPPHMRDDGDRRLRELMAPFGPHVNMDVKL